MKQNDSGNESSGTSFLMMSDNDDDIFSLDDDNPTSQQPFASPQRTEEMMRPQVVSPPARYDSLIPQQHSRFVYQNSSNACYAPKEQAPQAFFPKIDVVLSHRVDSKHIHSFLVKYQGKSYRSKEWIQTPSDEQAQFKIRQYLTKHIEKPPDPPFYPPEYDIPQKILSRKFGPVVEYLVLWTGLERKDATWETRASLNNDSLITEYCTIPSDEEVRNFPRPQPLSWKPVMQSPKSKSGKEIKSAQIDGMNFLINSWYNNHNAILADEASLDKNKQVCCFLNHLNRREHQYGPFLIIAPSNTLEKWAQEISDWTSLKLLVMNESDKQFILNYELKYEQSDKLRFQVMLTSNDIIQKAEPLKSIHWVGLIVDEGINKPKNQKARFFTNIKQFQTDFKIYMTNSPLPNNPNELFTILNFVEPKEFPKKEDFLQIFNNLNDQSPLLEFQQKIRTLMLRRTKEDMEEKVFPIEEIIIDCHMTSYQKFYYMSIFSKNQEYLKKGAKQKSVYLSNISMELKKVCNHPFLIEQVEDQIIQEQRNILHVPNENRVFELETMIKVSGKMMVLDKLLYSLVQEGHNVFIFTQMIKMLDLLQDFVEYRGYKYKKFDGSTRDHERLSTIETFDDKSNISVFLCYSKIVNGGINLACADRCIFFDNDWNPQQDILTATGCFRTNQQKEVKVYRLFNKKSYESLIYDFIVKPSEIDSDSHETEMDNKENKDLENMLRLGASQLSYIETKDNVDEDISTIINRSEKRIYNISPSTTLTKAKRNLTENEALVIKDPQFWKSYFENGKEKVKEKIQIDPVPSNGVNYSKRSFTQWNKKLCSDLIIFLTKFGISRVENFVAENKEIDVTKLLSVSKCIIKWMMSSSTAETQFPILDQFVQTPMTQFEISLSKFCKDNLFSLAAQNAKSRLKKIFISEMNHLIVSTSQSINEIAVPDMEPGVQIPNWSIDNDRLLMKITWEKGFGEVKADDLGMQESSLSFNLTKRLRMIITTFNQLYSQFESKNKGKLPINNATAWQVLQQISQAEHNAILHHIEQVGFRDPKAFCNSLKLHKSDDFVINYASDMVAEIKRVLDGNKSKTEKIILPINSSVAQRISKNIGLLDSLYECMMKSNLTPENRGIIQMTLDVGFEESLRRPEVQKFLGSDNPSLRSFQQALKKIIASDTAKKVVTPQVVQSNQNTPESITLPFQITHTLVLVSLGVVVYDREAFHTNRYAYCPGYITERLFSSLLNPSERVWYRSLVLDGGKNPIFRVEMKDNPEMHFDGQKPSNPWLSVMKAVEQKKRELGMQTYKNPSCSGPEFYGFTVPLISSMIMKLKNIEKCQKLKQSFLSEEGSTAPASKKVIPTQRQPTIKKNDAIVIVHDYPPPEPLTSSSSSSSEYEHDTGSSVSGDEFSLNASSESTANSLSNSSVDSEIEPETTKSNGLRFNFAKLLARPPDPEIHIVFPDSASDLLDVIRNCSLK